MLQSGVRAVVTINDLKCIESDPPCAGLLVFTDFFKISLVRPLLSRLTTRIAARLQRLLGACVIDGHHPALPRFLAWVGGLSHQSGFNFLALRCAGNVLDQR